MRVDGVAEPLILYMGTSTNGVLLVSHFPWRSIGGYLNLNAKLARKMSELNMERMYKVSSFQRAMASAFVTRLTADGAIREAYDTRRSAANNKFANQPDV